MTVPVTPTLAPLARFATSYATLPTRGREFDVARNLPLISLPLVGRVASLGPKGRSRARVGVMLRTRSERT